ncbi:MAG TPA: hypothetical protein VMW10_10485, partial [Alphaproteobacteria bacterium]|nr:hypothetical protein [Alphaproteobacteria bacterium]
SPVSKEFLEDNIKQHIDTTDFNKILESVKINLDIILYMTHTGFEQYHEAENEYKKLKTYKGHKDQRYLSVNLKPFDACGSNLLMMSGGKEEDRLFTNTSLPWLAPFICSESSLHFALVIKGIQATRQITKGTKELENAWKANNCIIRDYSEETPSMRKAQKKEKGEVNFPPDKEPVATGGASDIKKLLAAAREINEAANSSVKKDINPLEESGASGDRNQDGLLNGLLNSLHNQLKKMEEEKDEPVGEQEESERDTDNLGGSSYGSSSEINSESDSDVEGTTELIDEKGKSASNNFNDK